jgi:cytoplasmic iron level regulating protein YaaA (DUF328/UPF0246 family)
MIIIISPAKSLDFKTPSVFSDFTIPEFLNESEKLVGRLKTYSPKKLSVLMGISADLGELNFKRFQEWQLPFTPENSKQAILAFNGDVYQGLNATTFSKENFETAQDKLRILSGLYGVLKPMDLIQPYRLEMGTKLKYYKSKDLYSFWNPLITKKINEAVSESENKILVNLASNEYFKSIDKKKLKAEIVTPDFKEFKNGKYAMISFFAKRARGLMTRFIIENNISDPADLLAFDAEGYSFNSHLSESGNPVFTREQ